ncbi:MAG: winged helix-turn-helix transcriptional regulator [Candidatus Koribacter versatilis]|uniref:Winged helix-turn-helix transcriptional regulator n=1 Tax=Candidatus Korobacter versatilis TaxID=658062 RepID=A0A932ENR8_9BACT|nr:winged helix-turn-helix transcriptional regulator [Candidatus Koribacter versatilis]
MTTATKSSNRTTDERLSQLLHAVSDPARRRILKALKQKGCCSIGKPSGMCACDIEQKIGLSQPTISHHMAILRKAGLVQAEKQGPWMWYQRNDRALQELAAALAEGL